MTRAAEDSEVTVIERFVIDDSEEGDRPVRHVRLRLSGQAGLLLRRPSGPVPVGGGWRVDARARAMVVGAEDVGFLAVVEGELGRMALRMAQLPHVLSVVLCPVGVSSGRTALALSLADLLRARRSGGPVVTCGVRPRVRDDQVAIPHEIRVRVGEDVQTRVAWELVAGAAVPSWLAGLASGPVAA
jgi:hypothetical protein